MHDRLLTVDEIAERLAVRAETVRRWLRGGLLRGAHLPNKAGWRVRERDLDAFVNEHMNRPSPGNENQDIVRQVDTP